MSPIVPLLFMYSWLLLRMPADRMVHCGLMNGTSDRLFSVFNGQPVRVLTGRRGCQNVWQWRRIVQCGASKWRRYHELAVL